MQRLAALLALPALLPALATADGPVARFDWFDYRGEWQVLLRDADATLLSTRTAGGFIGATVGPFARKAD